MTDSHTKCHFRLYCSIKKKKKIGFPSASVTCTKQEEVLDGDMGDVYRQRGRKRPLLSLGGFFRTELCIKKTMCHKTSCDYTLIPEEHRKTKQGWD